MKKIILITLVLCATLTAHAQTVIPIVIEQHPPLQVIAETTAIELPKEGLTVGSDLIVEGGDGNYTYNWTNNAGEQLGTAKTLMITKPGDYFLSVTDGRQCQVSAKFTATATNGIYPTAHTKTIRQVRMINLSGVLVKTLNDIPDNGDIHFNSLGLQPGLYIVSYIYTDGSASVIRITVKS